MTFRNWLALLTILSPCQATVLQYNSGIISGGTIDRPGPNWTTLQIPDNSYASIIQDPTWHETYGFFNLQYNLTNATSAILSLTIDSFSYDGATNATNTPNFQITYGVKVAFNGNPSLTSYSYTTALPQTPDSSTFALTQSDLGQNYRTINIDFTSSLTEAKTNLVDIQTTQLFIYLKSVDQYNFSTARNPNLSFNIDASNAGNGVPPSNAATPFLTLNSTSAPPAIPEPSTYAACAGAAALLLALYRRKHSSRYHN